MIATEACVATESTSVDNVGVRLRFPAGAQLLVLLGTILALVSFSMSIAPSILFLLRAMPISFVTTTVLLAAVAAISSFLLGVGGFLIFLGFARARRDSLPWTLVVGVLMIATGAVAALADGTAALLWLATPGFSVELNNSLYLLWIVQEVAWVTLHALFIIGFLVLARTLIKKL